MIVVRSLLIPVVLGALFAILLAPWCKRIADRLGRGRGYAPLIVTASTMLLVMLPLVFIGVQAVAAVPELLERDIGGSISQFGHDAVSQINQWGRKLGIEAVRVRQALGQIGPRIAEALTAFASSTATALPGYLLDIFLFVVALYYLLRDGRRLIDWLKKISPFSEPDTEELFASVDETVHGAILGTIAVAVVQGGLTLIALLVMGIPGAFLWGVVAAICSFLPMVGTAPVTMGAAIYLGVTDRSGAAIAMAIIGVLVGLADNVVRPWAQSTRGGMHPLLALLAIFGGLELFGPFGIFVGPVIAAMALWAVDTYAHRGATARDDPPPESSIITLIEKP